MSDMVLNHQIDAWFSWFSASKLFEMGLIIHVQIMSSICCQFSLQMLLRKTCLPILKVWEKLVPPEERLGCKERHHLRRCYRFSVVHRLFPFSCFAQYEASLTVQLVDANSKLLVKSTAEEMPTFTDGNGDAPEEPLQNGLAGDDDQAATNSP